ncbi:uncharacterized protein LOC126579922 isoform X1 [Anopheles aquasalis]|uniref:uncharacterized protein LOC126579922 isoform X1 n=1 Tax=Anopheles aquasalis TaxID=42839 RepID=UPI00215A387D|nr:uncharacterized protein LOC126579922 isoform X1 [Anopheles aquasalis]
MPRMMVHWLCLAVFVIVLLVQCDSKDPYVTVGVERKATLQKIRRAYKQQAKEWRSSGSSRSSRHTSYFPTRSVGRHTPYITNEDAIVNRERSDYTTRTLACTIGCRSPPSTKRATSCPKAAKLRKYCCFTPTGASTV